MAPLPEAVCNAPDRVAPHAAADNAGVDVEIGSVADLVSAFGSVAALVAASVAAWAAIHANRHQGEQLRRLEEAERRRGAEADRNDAARVSLWTGVNSDGPAVWYANESGLPVYGLEVSIVIPGTPFRVEWASLGPRVRDGILRRVRDKLFAHTRDVAEVDWVGLLETDRFRCAAIFRDTSGRHWLRDFDGTLSRQDDRARAGAYLAAATDRELAALSASR